MAAVQNKPALIVVDLQRDFCENGSLAVSGAHNVVQKVNELISHPETFSCIVLTKDWHPRDHVSFFETHKNEPGAKLFAPFMLKNGRTQMLWPVHCVQNESGSSLHPDLHVPPSAFTVIKGFDAQADSYSAWMDEIGKKTTMEQVLSAHCPSKEVVCVGLAFDYCVGLTALDLKHAGYVVSIVEDATASVAEASKVTMAARLQEAGVKIVSSSSLQL